MTNSIFPILHFAPQTQIIICGIDCAPPIKEKLTSMGIEENTIVTILQTSKSNTLIVVKRDNRRIMLRCNNNLKIIGRQI